MILSQTGKVRIGIIGTCQVVGLRDASCDMLPAADIECYHVGANPRITDEALLALLPKFDLVISQLSDWDNHTLLRISHLRSLKLPVFYLPALAFTGFHPDITYIRTESGALIRGVDNDYHSIIIAAAHVLGLPQSRVSSLFNSFVFAELGYFDAFDASRKALLENFASEGIQLTSMFDRWVATLGRFMHTVNHPHIVPLASLARLALVRCGFLTSNTPVPANTRDYLGEHFVWPVYPALARRFGIGGSTTFLRHTGDLAEGQQRELSLADYIAAAYRAYDCIPGGLPRSGVIKTACERLEHLVVA